jgi:hypothetical protein
VNNPFEEIRAFSAWLINVPEDTAMNHLWGCFVEGGKDNMAFYLADYYQVQPYQDSREKVEAALQTIIDGLRKDSLNYDLSGFRFIKGGGFLDKGGE